MPFADTKQGSNTYLRLIWLALQAGGGGGGTAANVGVLSSASLRINPSTLELQQALLGAQFLPTVWQGTGGTYSTDQYLLQKNVSVTATPDYRWWLVDADGSMSQITGDVAIADRQLAGVVLPRHQQQPPPTKSMALAQSSTARYQPIEPR